MRPNSVVPSAIFDVLQSHIHHYEPISTNLVAGVVGGQEPGSLPEIFCSKADMLKECNRQLDNQMCVSALGWQ